MSPILKIFEHSLPLPKKEKEKVNKKFIKNSKNVGGAKGILGKMAPPYSLTPFFTLVFVIRRSSPTRKNDTTL